MIAQNQLPDEVGSTVLRNNWERSILKPARSLLHILRSQVCWMVFVQHNIPSCVSQLRHYRWTGTEWGGTAFVIFVIAIVASDEIK